MTEALPHPTFTQAALPANESERLAALRRYDILDTPPEAAFDRITALAARLFDMPIVLISLVDESRGWFKSCYGFDLCEVERDATISRFALLHDDVLVIPDTRQDSRLVCNPFVQSEPGLRFYAGAPLITEDGFTLGTLCLLDTKPRPALTDDQTATLTDLAAMVIDELELRLAARRIAKIERERQQAQSELENLVEQRTIELSKTNELLRLEITERQQAETALETEQELLKALLDNVQAGIVACNAEGILTLFNRAAREFHGLPERPLPPEQWADSYDLYMPDGKTRMSQENIPLFRALQEQTVDKIEMMIVPKQGTARTLLASGQAIADAQGNKQGAVVVMHDITERKQAEAERAQLIREQTARLESEADQQRSAFLVKVTTVLASSLNHEQTLASVANLVVPFFADWCTVDLLEANQEIRRVGMAHRDPEKVRLGWQLCQRYPRRIDDAKGIPKVLRTGKPELMTEIPDAAIALSAHDPDHLRILRELGLESFIISPLIARGQILGAISFITAESNRHYNKADLALAERIAHRAALALDNARLYQEAQQAQQAAEQAVARLSRLQLVTAALSESLTPTQVADVIVDQGIAALGANFALVALLNETSTELEIVQTFGCEGDQLDGWHRFSLNASVPLAEAVRTGKPIWAEASEQRAVRYPHLSESYEQYYEQYNVGSWISIPLMVEGGAVGGISFGFGELQLLEAEDQAFILSLAQQCAQAIARTHLYEAEQKARSQAEAANRIKDEFLAVLSHELRTPLNPILGWAKLLQKGKLNQAKTTQALATIERNAKLQSELIEDLLDVSRILQGKLSLNARPVDLADTIRAAVETVRLAAEAKSIQMQVKLDPHVRLVSGDANRLQQVIWNLLSNAVKFSPLGGKVLLQLEQLEEQAQIMVSDTGRGINPDFLPHVFDYFRQADGATTRKFGGLGLGLAIARHLVELHGGTVWAESSGEGLGATFRVCLPLMPTQLPAHQSGDRAPQSCDLSNISILVVDDDTDSRDFVAFLLEQSGAKVTAVASASEALMALTECQPDLLLSDIGMPEIDGYMLLQQIRQLPPQQGGQIPAIALTAFAGEINHQQALAAGFQRHISKPVEPDSLIEAIVSVVEEIRAC
jgi:PAS domain S-box-containing protein